MSNLVAKTLGDLAPRRPARPGKTPAGTQTAEHDSGKHAAHGHRSIEPFVPGGRPPVLEVAWIERHAHILDDLRALLFGPGAGKLPAKLRFHDSWRPRRYWALCFWTSALGHVLFIALPLPFWLAATTGVRDLRVQQEMELTFPGAGALKTLPELTPKSSPRRSEPAPAPAPEPSPEAAPPRMDRASRQVVMTNPARPNHPRQMLLQPASAPEPPKLLPDLPNIVEWGRATQVARPRMPISREVLARLRPKAAKRRAAVEAAAPALPNQELTTSALSISSVAPEMARPRMPVAAASVPVAAERRQVSDAAAPELGDAPPIPGLNGNSDSGRRVIALSADPAPPPPSLDIPAGNLSARVALSPLGPMPGPDAGGAGSSNGNGPGGTGAGGSGTGGGAGRGPAEVLISSGDPSRTANVVGPGSGAGGSGRGSGLAGSGFGGTGSGAGTGSAGANPSRLSSRDLAAGSRPGIALPEPPSPQAQALGGYEPPRPEDAVFRQKRVYSLSVNLPNMTSISGSWIVKFAELDPDLVRPSRTAPGALASPEPIRKVDPKYPQALVEARIEGEVVLYAIIRKDGTVDSVQVLKQLDPQLDANAAQAFTKWQFWPAMRDGVPVDIEAVITIPFRALAPRP